MIAAMDEQRQGEQRVKSAAGGALSPRWCENDAVVDFGDDRRLVADGVRGIGPEGLIKLVRHAKSFATPAGRGRRSAHPRLAASRRSARLRRRNHGVRSLPESLRHF